MFALPEQVTIWQYLGDDGLGGITWGAPEVVTARYAYKQEKFTDTQGNDAISRSVVYTEAQAGYQSKVFLGVSASPTPTSDAQMVRAISQVPSGAGNLKKLWL